MAVKRSRGMPLRGLPLEHLVKGQQGAAVSIDECVRHHGLEGTEEGHDIACAVVRMQLISAELARRCALLEGREVHVIDKGRWDEDLPT